MFECDVKISGQRAWDDEVRNVAVTGEAARGTARERNPQLSRLTGMYALNLGEVFR